MSHIKMNAMVVHKLAQAWFDKKNKECEQEHTQFIAELCTKRRFFGLLPPKYKLEDFENVTPPTIFDSMNFQRMYPHYEIYDLMQATKGGTMADVFVDVKIAAYLRG